MLKIIFWPLLAVLDLVVTAVAFILAPILPLFADDGGWLPSWLGWFQTLDNSLDGDEGWKTEHYVGWPQYPKRVLWLWRNPGYGFSQKVLAAKFERNDEYEVYGDETVSNIPGNSGHVLRVVYRNGIPHYFQYYLIRQYKFKTDRCFRLNLGWKLWGFKTGKASFVTAVGFWNQYDVR